MEPKTSPLVHCSIPNQVLARHTSSILVHPLPFLLPLTASLYTQGYTTTKRRLGVLLRSCMSYGLLPVSWQGPSHDGVQVT